MLKIPHSYYVCSAEQSRNMDEKTIKDFGISGFTLMEVAGTRAADFIQSRWAPGSSVLICCGKGNNAGDALVVGRLLAQQDFTISVCFLAGADDLSPDTQKNYELLQKLDSPFDLLKPDQLDSIEPDLIIDGMLGTGLHSDVRSPYDEVIQWINKCSAEVFALDIPTGLHTDSGHVLGTAVKADYTLSFGSLKTGFYLNEGFDHTGDVILCELPFPNKYKEPTAYLLDHEWVDINTPSTQKTEHKYDGGVLYIIAGSEGLTGAGILAAKSAWASGLGAVVLITPKGLLEIYEKNLIQIIKKSVGTDQDTCFKTAHIKEVHSILAERPGKLLIGPGLGRKSETKSFILEILEQFQGDVVIDADALHALATSDSWAKPNEAHWVLTPHPGELRSLVGTDLSDDLLRLKESLKLAHQQDLTILSKGMPSIIGTNSGDAYLTGYDTRIFSRAGFGDVLAGKVGAYWLKYGTTELACFHALIDGYKKSTRYYKTNSGSSLEPIDII